MEVVEVVVITSGSSAEDGTLFPCEKELPDGLPHRPVICAELPLFTDDQTLPLKCRMVPFSPTANTSAGEHPEMLYDHFGYTTLHLRPGTAIVVKNSSLFTDGKYVGA